MGIPSNNSDLWALAPYTTKELDKEYFLLVRNSDGASAVLDSTWLPNLDHLKTFRTISEHAENVVGNIPSSQIKKTETEAALSLLIEKGLFQGTDQLLNELEQGNENLKAYASLRIAITTCERPAELKRLLDSIHTNEERFGNRWTYEVIDDSRSPETLKKNQSIVQDAGHHIDIHYVGPVEQKAFLDNLIQAVPEAEDIRWLLERDEEETEPTYGLPMNLAILRHAGHRLLLIDDDAVIAAAQVDDSPDAPRFDKHQQSQAFVSKEEARKQFKPYNEDPFLSHERVLGHPVGSVINHLSKDNSLSSFAGEKIKNISKLKPLNSQLKYTLNGVLGDTGSHNDLWLFSPNRKALPGVAGNESRYLKLKQSNRIVYRGSPWASFYDSAWLHQVTCAGVDLTQYIAPINPTGRGADSMLGHILNFLYPNDYGILLPFTLEHWAAGDRPWRFDTKVFTFNPSINGLLGSFFSSLRIPKECDPAKKMIIFAETLLNSLHNDKHLHSLQGIAKRGYLNFLTGHYKLLSHSLKTLEESSPSWQQDVQELLQEIIKQLGYPPEMSEEHELRIRSGLSRYAKTIPAWNKAFEHCRTHSLI